MFIVFGRENFSHITFVDRSNFSMTDWDFPFDEFVKTASSPPKVLAFTTAPSRTSRAAWQPIENPGSCAFGFV